MTTKIDELNPYLHFGGNCGETIAFYQKTLGAEVIFKAQFKDMPPEAKAQCPTPMPGENIMHARVRIGKATVLMSDGRCSNSASFSSFSLSLTAPDAAEAERIFKALSEGGKVMMPVTKTFFSPAFGMTADRFGVPWMVYVEGGPAK